MIADKLRYNSITIAKYYTTTYQLHKEGCTWLLVKDRFAFFVFFIAFILLEPDSVESEEGFELVEWPYPAPTPEKGEWPRSP